VRANLWRVTVLIVGAALLIAFETWMFLSLDISEELRWFLIGLVPTLIIVLVVVGLVTAFLTHEPEGIHQVRGAWGEDFTRDELVRARRKRLIWGWVDSVTLQTGDIDHLVVTRFGGLVSIDTKWRSGADRFDPAALAREANRVRVRAEGFVNSILKAERGSRRASGKGYRVSALVVLWGAPPGAIPDGASVEGVEFIEGRGLIDWLTKLDGDPIEEAAAADVLAEFERRRARAWPTSTTRSTR
jgi:hypothetical protein